MRKIVQSLQLLCGSMIGFLITEKGVEAFHPVGQWRGDKGTASNSLSIRHSLPLGRQDSTSSTIITADKVTGSSPSSLINDEQVIAMFDKAKISGPWRKLELFNTKLANTAMLKLAESNVGDKGELAHLLLKYMISESSSNQREDLRPDLRTLNTMLSALSKSAPKFSTKSAALADEVFLQWQNMYATGIVDENVDIFTYNTLLSAHVKAQNMVRAEEIFSAMKQNINDATNDPGAVVPDEISFATLMRGYASQGKTTLVEALFEEMKEANYVELTVESFNEVLYAYSKSFDPSRAEECLQKWLEDNPEAHFQPNVRSYNIVLYSMAQDDRPGAVTRAEKLFNEMPQRDVISYTTITALYCSRLMSKIAVQAAERVIDKAFKDPHAKINAAIVSNLLYSLATVEDKEMPACAERLVATATKKKIRLDIAVYNALIYCWAKSGDFEAARRSRQILATVEKRSNLRPNLKTYTNVLDCFAKSREQISLDFAKEIIEKMERNGPEPNVHAYTSLIQNYARSRLPNKAVEASRILERMKESSNPEAQPNIVTYNAVLNAAEHSDASGGAVTEAALKVACLVFDEIRTSTVAANHVTYGTFLGVLGKLMPMSSRQEISGLVFRRACKEGQVSPLVLRKVRQAVGSTEHFLSLLEGHDEDTIPPAWSANVREMKAREVS